MITHWIHADPSSLVQRLSFDAAGIAVRSIDFSAESFFIGRRIVGYKKSNQPIKFVGRIIVSESITEDERKVWGCGSITFTDPSTFGSSGSPELSVHLIVNEGMFSFVWSNASSPFISPFTITTEFVPQAQLDICEEWDVALEPKLKLKEVRIARSVSVSA